MADATEVKPAEGQETKPVEGENKTFTQEQVNHMMAEHKRGLQERAAEAEQMRQELSKYKQMESEKTQADLEAQKEYEKAKENLASQVAERDRIIKEKEQSLQGMTISNTLSNELSKQNGYIEESMALLRNQAVIKEDGTVSISGKDKNGLAVELSIADGVKQFLESRPHLVKSTHKGGADTSTGGSVEGAGSAGQEDLDQLNERYQKAQTSGDFKTASELKMKISAVLGARGITGQI